MLFNRIMADVVLTLHFCIVLFVISGLLFVLVGYWRGWNWIRNFYFRMLHLVAIGVVVMQAWLGMACPLTRLENYFRRQSGQAEYPGSFITYWMHELLYFEAAPWVFTVCYTVFGLAVVAGLVLAPPRIRRGDGAHLCSSKAR